MKSITCDRCGTVNIVQRSNRLYSGDQNLSGKDFDYKLSVAIEQDLCSDCSDIVCKSIFTAIGQ